MFWAGIVEYFDEDGDNLISLEELGPLLQGINPCPEEGTVEATEELLHEIDTNGDNLISTEELYEYMRENKNKISPQLFPMANELMWQVFLSMDEGSSVGDMIMNDWQLDPIRESKAKEDKTLRKEILVQVRRTGKLEKEKIPNYIRVSLRLIYSSRLGRHTVSGHKVQRTLKYMTNRQGRNYESPESCQQIQPFIKQYNIDLSEMKEEINSFRNFNEFFYRKVIESYLFSFC